MHCIGIDCRFAGTQTGLGRYTRELVSHLLLRRDAFHYALFVPPEPQAWIPQNYGSAYSLHPVPFSHYSLAEQTRFPSLIKKAAVDLFFSPHFNVPLFCPAPTVVTIHDLILHRYPNDASVLRQLAYRFLFRQAVSRSQRVIAVSGFTASELRSFYGPRVQPKLSVIAEAVPPSFSRRSPEECRAVIERTGIAHPFYLYVGNAKEHKNVQMLIDAFAALQDPEKELVLVTGGKEAGKLTLRPGVRLIPSISDDDLPALYTSALCFVSASLYEGFGLPLLEAHACGCPGIVTNRASFPEIAPPGTTLCEPSVDAFARAMQAPPQWQPATTTRTWADAAAETVDVFRSAVKGV